MSMDTILPFGSRTFVMGIINLTPDSFSGDGLMEAEDVVAAAVRQAAQFTEDGVDILDLGAESSRPGSEPISAEEEMERLLPTLEHILSMRLDVLISIDTYKAQVAKECLALGAHMINDIWALRKDPQLAQVIAKANAPIILMHNRSQMGKISKTTKLGGMYTGSTYQDLMADIYQDLLESINIAKEAGVANHNIILDPGIGFGKSVEENLRIIKELRLLKEKGYPILLGPSRKSFIGYTLDLPPEERLEGTLAAAALGIHNGADILRVHDVKETVRVARMCDAILKC